jgi:hypothetical protein
MGDRVMAATDRDASANTEGQGREWRRPGASNASVMGMDNCATSDINDQVLGASNIASNNDDDGCLTDLHASPRTGYPSRLTAGSALLPVHSISCRSPIAFSPVIREKRRLAPLPMTPRPSWQAIARVRMSHSKREPSSFVP